MNLLFIGDVVSTLGRQTVASILPSLRQEFHVDFVIANGENLVNGRGASVQTLDELARAGVDYFTSGDHIFWGDESKHLLNDPDMRLLRPANYPEDVWGRGFHFIHADGFELGIINLIGNTGVNNFSATQDLFRTVDTILAKHGGQFPIVIDLHGEYATEKLALAHYAAGRVSAVVGTHTHVGTVDTKILKNHTGYVSDVGMVGSYNSIVGVDADTIISSLKYPYPQRFNWVDADATVFNSVLITVTDKGVCTSISRADRIIP